MKGPHERLKYDLRRVWECPRCQERQRTDGTITGLVCNCQQPIAENERVSMRLVHDDIRRRSVKQPEPSAPAAPPVEDDIPTSDPPATERPTEDPAAPEPCHEEPTATAPTEAETGTAENVAASNTGEENPENSDSSVITDDTVGPA